MAKKMVDPICGMTVTEDTQYKSTYNGKEYFFCCEHCKTQFDSNPIKYTR